MSAKKVSVHDLDDAEQQIPAAEQIIGRIYNDRTQGFRWVVPVEQQEIGRINNEQEPYLRGEILSEEQVIGVINNEKRD